jgi:nucleotide-binding universal stress UspA family protein
MTNSRRADEYAYPVPDSGATRIAHAVVGFDGSPASHDAVAYAAGWAHRVGGRLDIVYVADLVWQSAIEACVAMSFVGVVLDSVPELLDGLAADMSGSGLQWSYAATRGDIARELERSAETANADAIIIGSSRRHRTVRPSVAHRLLHHAKRIVIIVP